MRTLRLPVGALLVALVLAAVLAVGASATPVARTVATVQCEDTSVTLLMHPGGGGKAIWDISLGSVQNSPSYLIQRVEATFYNSNGEPEGGFDNSVGKKTGLLPLTICGFRVDGDGFYALGSLHLVQL
jgi:hypothetical protein